MEPIEIHVWALGYVICASYVAGMSVMYHLLQDEEMSWLRLLGSVVDGAIWPLFLFYYVYLSDEPTTE